MVQFTVIEGCPSIKKVCKENAIDSMFWRKFTKGRNDYGTATYKSGGSVITFKEKGNVVNLHRVYVLPEDYMNYIKMQRDSLLWEALN